MPPCERCAAHIVQAGIKAVYAPMPQTRWAECCRFGERLMSEAGVESFWFGREVPTNAAGA
jgi:deoxycytidylate deaminase